MRTSTDINLISEALQKSSKEIKNAKMDGQNPHFKNKYATLESVLEAIKPAIDKNELFVFQAPESGKTLLTRISHKSGQFFEFDTPLITTKEDMQQLGSAITYARRYAISAAFSLTQEDDDGNGAGAAKDAPPSDYTIKTKGNALGKKLSELSLDAIQKNVNYWQKRAKDEGTGLKGTVKEDVEASIKYLQEQAELGELK